MALYNRVAEDRRFELFHLDAHHVGPSDDIQVLRVTAPRSFQEFLAINSHPTEPARYTDFDLIYSRADKPFPPAYLPGLIRLEQRVRFVARPSSVLECDARTFYRGRAARFLPPGMVTRNVDEASRFIRETGAVVAKQNRSYGGKGVWRIRPAGASWTLDHGDRNVETSDRVETLVEIVCASDPEPFEFVRFLPRVSAGDKRVMVAEGEIHGAVLRVSGSGSWINNITHGAMSKATSVGDAERRAIAETCGMYHDRGLLVLGYDFLQDDGGEWILSEINPGGNIGGYAALERATGRPSFPPLLDWLLDFGAR